ncbi:hypothetical protein [Acetonema longum]|uniref:Uncharacterized protein n=1 Tax=Acetonema longum DSM 6540 TaxID=1009370 RepID=F7NKJ3_9FIRM|nr:hypothetical protein [Acetonema longum]EGO63445.1 hypothetical protein ALO_13035 [Acetonema longum DSM 6540]
MTDSMQQAINELKELLGKGYSGEIDRGDAALQAAKLLLGIVSCCDLELTAVDEKLDRAIIKTEHLEQRVERLQTETKELRHHNADMLEYLDSKGLAKDFDRFQQEKKIARILH